MKLDITIDVDNLERAITFYCEGLGLTLVKRDPVCTQVELNGQTLWLCPKIASNVGRHWTPVHLDFMVDDLDKAVERALAAGGRLEEIRRNYLDPIGCRADIANLSDPAGNGVDLIQRHW